MMDKAASIFTTMLAGYLIGMVIGFTAFDPNMDVWALLGFALAVVGIGVGLLPTVRRNRGVVLGTIIGFYLGWLLNFLLFGDAQENGLNLFQNGIGGFLLITLGALVGGWFGWRYRSTLKDALFAAVFGGFLGGLLLGTALGIGGDASMLTWAIPVIVTAVAVGSVTWWLQTKSQAMREI